jgi:ParB-like chromosome segregation protein Spo0J
VIAKDNTVVAGNGTLSAARSLGWQTIEAVRIPEDWTTNQIKAFALADNRTAELASWLPEVLAQQLFELEIAGFEIDILAFDQQSTANFEPIESNERLDTKSSKFCPECGHDITNY